MYRLGDQFLADPGFSSDQNVQVGTCHHFDLSFQLLHDLAEPDHFGAGFARRDMTDGERRNGLTLELLDQQRIGQGSRSEGAHQSQLGARSTELGAVLGAEIVQRAAWRTEYYFT